MNFRRIKCVLALQFFCLAQAYSQYILNGSAQQNSCNCYTLTQAVQTQSGSVWNANKISLNNSFDFWFNVFLGCNDAGGADGIVFMLQPLSTSVGSTGEGMGFNGVSPSIGITLDTWQNSNLNDPAYDHISIQANGVVAHGSDLAGPVPASATGDNIEDCQWHKLRITWNASTKWLRTYFDGVLRLEKQVDLVANVFNNDPNVYWGFSGATGGSVNLQQFCTALDPVFTVNFSNNVVCNGTPVLFSNVSESFAPIIAYTWSFGDGTTYSGVSPPPHLYAAPGTYSVNLKIKGQDGCERDSTKAIIVAPLPSADLAVFDTCAGKPPRVNFVSPAANVAFTWQVDGVTAGNTQPLLNGLAAGNHQLAVTVSSTAGCGADVTASSRFDIRPVPTIDAMVTDGCAGVRLTFNGSQTDALTNIVQWTWLAGSNALTGQVVQPVFGSTGDYAVKLWATASNGCVSDTSRKTVKIAQAFLIADDTSVVKNKPAQLRTQTNGSVVWSPSTGLSNAAIPGPVATLSANQKYTLTATTPEGCTATDTMLVKVFNGATVYVPSAFTPNGDGRNDVLLPVYVGIRELKQFAVFNRWGQLVFTTADMNKGWTGTDSSGTYVWLASAVDYAGQPIVLKGTTTIIR